MSSLTNRADFTVAKIILFDLLRTEGFTETKLETLEQFYFSRKMDGFCVATRGIASAGIAKHNNSQERHHRRFKSVRVFGE